MTRLSRSAAFAAGLAALCQAGCDAQAVLIEVRAEGLEAPGDLDSFCLAVGDLDPSGGEFARSYRLGDDVAGLPQTLAVDAGEASAAFAWVRGYRRGIEVARDAASFTFGDGDLALTLSGCPGGPGGPPSRLASAAVPAGSIAALAVGRTGTELIAVGDGSAALQARDEELEPIDAAAPEGPVRDLVAFDVDGDCDDDLLAVIDGGAELWRREPDGSYAAIDGGPRGEGARTAAAADVDGDGDIDVALGGDQLTVWLNDGAGRFARHPTPVEGDGGVDVTRLGFGDFDGDGAVDLAAARGAEAPAAPRILVNAGDGAFSTVPGALPDLPLRVRALAVRDMNGDGADDLVAAGDDMPVKLYLGRGDGRLDDQSFPRLPDQEPIAAASLAASDWDGDCLVDLVVGLAEGGAPLSWRGDAAGTLVDDGDPAAEGEQVLLADADDDGDIDLVTVDGGDNLTWTAR